MLVRKLPAVPRPARAAAEEEPRRGVPGGDPREGPDRDRLPLALAEAADQHERERLAPAAQRLGGPAALVERARPLLETLGSSLVHVGDRPGDGDAAKTINNMLSATNLAAAAEALAMGMRAGLDPERLVDCVNGGTGASNAMEKKVGAQVLTGKFASRFTLGQYLKDLGIARGLADDHRVPTPVNGAAHAVWTSHAARGHADADHTRLVELLLADAGIEHDFAGHDDDEEAAA
jgi:hypothetical protein